MSDYMEETGDPFTGKKKEELKKFLEYMDLLMMSRLHIPSYCEKRKKS